MGFLNKSYEYNDTTELEPNDIIGLTIINVKNKYPDIEYSGYIELDLSNGTTITFSIEEYGSAMSYEINKTT